MLFSLANSDGDDAIFINRGSILVFLPVLVSSSFGNAIATVSFGVVLGLKFPSKNGIFGAQPAATLKVKSNSKRLSNL